MLSSLMAGVGSYSGLVIGIVIVLLLVIFLKGSFKLVWNAIFGALLLWVVNLIGGIVGFTMKITLIKALIAGFFGIPGAVAVILFELFAK